MQAIVRFTKENPVGSTLTLITSDADFAPDLAKAKVIRILGSCMELFGTASISAPNFPANAGPWIPCESFV